jgi:tetratricopeptide (TPR) repeat protein
VTDATDTQPRAVAEAESLRRQAVSAIEDYQPDLAASLLDQAWELLEDLPRACAALPEACETRARIRLAQSWTTFEREGQVAAAPVLADALDLARAQDRLDLVALCLMQGATMSGRSGDLPGALTLMRQAEAGLTLLPLPDQVRLVLNRGLIAAQVGQLDDARDDLGRAADLAARAGAPPMEFMARHNRGYVEYLRGDLPAALSLMESADAMDVAVSRSVSLLDQARVLLEAGLIDEAAHSLRRARDLASAEGGGQDLGEIELDLARTLLLLGDPHGSAELAGQARRRFHDRAAAPWRRQAQLVELEAGSAARDHPERTARIAAALAEAASRHGEVHVCRRARLIEADARLDLGEIEPARAAYTLARPLLTSASLPTRLHLRLVAARLATADPGSPTRRATRHLTEAADDLARTQRRVSSLDVRTALAVHSNRLALLDLGIGVEQGSPASLLARTERWRAVSDRVPLVRPPRDSRAADLLTQLRRTREDLRGAPAEAQVDLRSAATDLERRIRALDWARSDSGTPDWRPARPVSYPAALAAVRAADATLVSYVPHGPDLYAVCLTPRGGRVLRVARSAEVSGATRRLRADVEAVSLPSLGPMQSAVEASLATQLAALDRLLIGPIAANSARSGSRSGSRSRRLALRPARPADHRAVPSPERHSVGDVAEPSGPPDHGRPHCLGLGRRPGSRPDALAAGAGHCRPRSAAR